MAFETFKRQRAAPATEPTLTIQRRGTLSLNTPAFDALERPKHVELLFDPDEKLIGLRKAASTAPHAYPVRGIGKNAATHAISGKGFLKYYGIKLDVARRWPAVKQGDVLVVDLKRPGTELAPRSGQSPEGGG
jgi:hypothetical protein